MTTQKVPVIGSIKSWNDVKSALDNLRNYLSGLGTLKGEQGLSIRGPAGVGVPTGGNAGQLLQKHSTTDYDTEWVSKDVANGVAGLNASARIVKGADTTDDLIIDLTTKGLVLKDSDAHYWRITISTAGALVFTDLGLTKP